MTFIRSSLEWVSRCCPDQRPGKEVNCILYSNKATVSHILSRWMVSLLQSSIATAAHDRGWCAQRGLPDRSRQCGPAREHRDKYRETRPSLYTSLGQHHERSESFRTRVQRDKEALEKSKKYAATLEAGSGLSHHILPVPAVFIVQKDGSIIFEYVNPKL